MKIAGIVAEYNPFHRGHAYHVQQTRRLTGCDFVIACMAGHFTQRGEPALWSKWARARMALASGVDAVFELPALFAVRTADAFSRGGVAILGGLGVDALSFGSETDDRVLLSLLADLRRSEPEALSGTMLDLLDRDPKERKTFVTTKPGKGVQEAILDYEVLSSENGLSLVKIFLQTGRTHQIRCQFSSRGLPLWGDRKYSTLPDDGPIALWSHCLHFAHPDTGEILCFEHDPPEIEPWTSLW